ncbi:MAG: hypothetical protein NVSMB25_15400 [Thermoleophilaceae bacterium]
MVTLDPTGLLLVALLVGMYARAVRILRARGYEVPAVQRALWYLGTAVVAVGLLGPPDALSGDLFSAHMAEHLLIADIAAPLLLAGARTPVLVFLLPRSVLVPLARARGLRRLFRALRRPLVALPLWVLILYGWHFGFAFQGALRNPVLHVLQHESFFVGSALVWWSVVEPNRRHLRGELWKIGHIIGMRVAGMFLGMAFVIMQSPAYSWYGERAHRHGLRPLTDQQVGGGMMLGLDLFVMLFALGFFFWRAAQDYDRGEASAGAASSVTVGG